MVVKECNSKIKILLDTEDLKSSNILLDNWLISPKENIHNLLGNIPKYKNIDVNTIKDINIYSIKLIIFYISILV